VDGTNNLEEITASMFTAELHHLGSYISQLITLKCGVVNKQIINIHHYKNLYSCVYKIFPSSRTK